MFWVLGKNKYTYATKANKEASTTTSVFGHSGISKSMEGTAFIVELMNVDLPDCPLEFVNGKEFLLEFAL